MDPKKAKWRTVSFKDNVMTITKDIPNIIVLVGGTVDPGNMLMNRYKNDPENFKRSESYDSPEQPAKDTNWYWSENEELLKSLDTIKKKYRDIHIFPYHGWSGDNCIKNREIAGAYLAERLCGANGEKPYYEQFLKADVSFHFIGHSHGGNVINEFTKHIATLKGWPEGWKIRTITYLSTPFYQKLHRVNTLKFDEDCKIFNVTNKYDLTQRCIADFNLEQLMDITATLKRSDIGNSVKVIQKFNYKQLKDCLTSPHLEIKRDGWKMTSEWMMDKAKGRDLYKNVQLVLKAIRTLISETIFIVEALNRNTKYFANDENKKRDATFIRKMIDDELKNRILKWLVEIDKSLATTIQNFENRLAGNNFPVFDFLQDLRFDLFFSLLIEFFHIDTTTLKGPFIDIISDLFFNIIDKFDNTGNSPLHQFKGTVFESSIVNLSVSYLDKFFKIKDNEYNNFITFLEKCESNYSITQSEKHLKDLIVTLIAQHESIQKGLPTTKDIVKLTNDLLVHWAMYDGFRNIDKPFIQENIEKLWGLLDSYVDIIEQHQPSGIVVETDQEPKRGSLGYLMIISHSVSRNVFHTIVSQQLEKELDTIIRNSQL